MASIRRPEKRRAFVLCDRGGEETRSDVPINHRVSIVAITYHLFFAMCGVGGIALVLYRLWDLKTAAYSDDAGIAPTIITAALMVGFSVYGIFFRKRVYARYFGQEIGDIPAAENLMSGVAWILIGLVIWMWSDYLAIGAILWGVFLSTHGVLQFILLGAPRKQRKDDCGRPGPAQ